jgi:hypothetical protein
MALCKDEITKHLKSFKYNTIYPPRASALPMEVLVKNKGGLTRWGYLDDVFQSDEPLPEVLADGDTLDIQGQITGRHDISLGITILGSLISAAGGNLGIKAVYKTARTLKFQYEQVTRHFVKPVRLDAYISRGAPVDGLFTTAELLEDDRLFIFTSVLKACKVVVEAEKSGGGSLEVEVPVIQQMVGGNVAVTPENSTNTRVGYEGKIPVGFGFKAVKIDYDDGSFRLKPVPPGSVTAAAVAGNEPDGDYEVMVFEEDYVRVGG